MIKNKNKTLILEQQKKQKNFDGDCLMSTTLYTKTNSKTELRIEILSDNFSLVAE